MHQDSLWQVAHWVSTNVLASVSKSDAAVGGLFISLVIPLVWGEELV